MSARLVRGALAIVLGLAAGGFAEQLPAGPGRELVIETCIQCHDLRPILSQKKPAAAWRRTVNEMAWRGAALFPGEAQAVADYLGACFGEASRPAPARPATASENEAAARSLPPGDGRELLLSACVSCHGLATTTALRKSEPEWRRSVEQMAALGARLGGREQEILTRYLGAALGDRP